MTLAAAITVYALQATHPSRFCCFLLSGYSAAKPNCLPFKGSMLINLIMLLFTVISIKNWLLGSKFGALVVNHLLLPAFTVMADSKPIKVTVPAFRADLDCAETLLSPFEEPITLLI